MEITWSPSVRATKQHNFTQRYRKMQRKIYKLFSLNSNISFNINVQLAQSLKSDHTHLVILKHFFSQSY